MNKKKDVVREYTEAVWSNPPTSAMAAEATFLSDDFQNLDNDGNVLMDKKAVNLQKKALRNSFIAHYLLPLGRKVFSPSGRRPQVVGQKKSTNDCGDYSVNWIGAKGCSGKPPCADFNNGKI